MLSVYVTGPQKTFLPFVCISRFEEAIQDNLLRLEGPPTTCPKFGECTVCIEKTCGFVCSLFWAQYILSGVNVNDQECLPSCPV